MSNYEWRLTIKGGPGSGNWGHSGRPGQVGGSGSGGGGVASSILTEAKQKEPGITSTVQGTVESQGGEMDGLEFRLKDQESLGRKVESTAKELGISHDEARGHIRLEGVQVGSGTDRDVVRAVQVVGIDV